MIRRPPICVCREKTAGAPSKLCLGGGGGDKTHLAETPASEIGRNFSPRITDPGSIRALAPGTCIPRFSAILSLAILAANPAQAQTPPAATPSLATQISALISAPEVSRDHWGILVTTLDGTPIYALNEAQLFQPDSNAKLFTTAAALALLGPDKTFETTVAGSLDARSGTVEGDLVLTGGGDANLSARELPYASHPQLSKVSSPLPILCAIWKRWQIRSPQRASSSSPAMWLAMTQASPGNLTLKAGPSTMQSGDTALL